jgi:ferredoxin like protein
MRKIEDKLALNRFVVDEALPHIVLEESRLTHQIKQALLNACPAGLYVRASDGKFMFEHAGCLECGTCRVICAAVKDAIKWEYPRATKGVFYRYG